MLQYKRIVWDWGGVIAFILRELSLRQGRIRLSKNIIIWVIFKSKKHTAFASFSLSKNVHDTLYKHLCSMSYNFRIAVSLSSLIWHLEHIIELLKINHGSKHC